VLNLPLSSNNAAKASALPLFQASINANEMAISELLFDEVGLSMSVFNGTLPMFLRSSRVIPDFSRRLQSHKTATRCCLPFTNVTRLNYGKSNALQGMSGKMDSRENE
jgi:hypothetical protein